MKIALIADSEQELDLFPELAAALEDEMKDLEVKEFFVPSMLDIPAKCVEAEKFDLIFAMHLYNEEDAEKDFRIKLLLEKLVDFELDHKGCRVLKAVEPSGLEDALTEEDIEAVKAAFVEKWKAVISGMLFDQEAFRPSPEESEGDEDLDEDDSDDDGAEDEEEPARKKSRK